MAPSTVAPRTIQAVSAAISKHMVQIDVDEKSSLHPIDGMSSLRGLCQGPMSLTPGVPFRAMQTAPPALCLPASKGRAKRNTIDR